MYKNAFRSIHVALNGLHVLIESNLMPYESDTLLLVLVHKIFSVNVDYYCYYCIAITITTLQRRFGL